jgi:type IV pilus biogenesis protein CpaD/CtpE
MNIKPRFFALAAFAALAVGCTPTDATFGNAVRTTMAAQVVNPEPHYDDPVPSTEAVKAAAAVDRYRTDKVKKPDTIRTTQGQAGTPQ